MQIDGVVGLVVPGRFIDIVYDRDGEKYTLELPIENFPEAEEGMDFSIVLYGGYVAKRGTHMPHEGHSIANGMNDSNREQLARIDDTDGEEHH